MKTLITIICLISLLFLIACGDDDSPAEETPVRLAFAPSAMQGEEPYTLTVTVTGEGMKEMKSETTFTGKQASLEFPAIPSGPDRLFTVEVKDKNGIILYSGTTTQSLNPGKPATVSIPTTRTTIPVTVKVTTSEISPDESYTLTVTITGERMDEMKAETTLAGKNAQIDLPAVPSGSNRIFTVEVSKNGIVLSSGAATQSLVHGKPVTVSIPITQITITNPKDGAEMNYIPEGEFLMGSDRRKDSLAREDELPQRKIYLDAYYIYKHEVTVAQYRKFCQATGRPMPPAPSWGWQDNHPIVNVSWDDAVAYCKWAGVELPTEAQWEKVARGTDRRIWPWGNKWDASKCNNWNTGPRRTMPVGSYPAGASPYRVMDMAGNVWEWCADWYDEKYYSNAPNRNPQGPSSGTWRVLRGGSCYYDYPRYFRAANRAGFFPDGYLDFNGFRGVALRLLR